MRRLVNTFLIEMNRPEGEGSVPQAYVAKGWSGSKALRDVDREELPLGRTSQRVGSSDWTDSQEPLGRVFVC